MMRLFSILLFLGVIVFSSCKKPHADLPYIPKDAVFVMHLNNESILKKVPISEWKKNEVYQLAIRDSGLTQFMKEALENPEITGVEVEGDFFVYFMQDAQGQLVATHGRLKDAEKFKAFVSNFEGFTLSASGNNQMMESPTSAGIWDKERFLFVMGLPKVDKRSIEEMMNDANPSLPEVTRNLSADAARLFDLKTDESLAKEKKFIKLMQEKADMHFWMNNYALYTNNPDLNSIAMLNLDKLYKDNYLAGVANFEDGKISADVKSYTNKEMTNLIRKYSGENIDKDLVNRFDGSGLAALQFANFKPEGIKAILDYAGFLGLLNMGASMAGFNVDDVINAFKGDFAIAVQNLNENEIQNIEFIFSAYVKEKAALDKILNSIKKLSPEATENLYMETRDDLFVLSNKADAAKAYLDKKPAEIPAWDKLSKSAVGGFYDLQYIIKSIPVTSTDTSKVALYELNKNMWKDFYFTGGKFKNGAFHQHFELNLIDNKTNSLMQLNHFINQLALLEKNRKAISSSIPDLLNTEPDTLVSPTMLSTEL